MKEFLFLVVTFLFCLVLIICLPSIILYGIAGWQLGGWVWNKLN